MKSQRLKISFIVAASTGTIPHGFGWILPSSQSRSVRSTTARKTLPIAEQEEAISESETPVPSTTTKATIPGGDEDNKQLSDFKILAGNVALCLIRSDLKRDSGFDGSSTGWTSWVDEESAFRLQKCIEKLKLVSLDDYGKKSKEGSKPLKEVDEVRTPAIATRTQNQRQQQDKDEILRWLRWLKSSPSPMVVELTDHLRRAVNETITSVDLERVCQGGEEFLARIALRLFVLPSGSSLGNNLRTEPGAMVYGKLLYGGVTRYRMIGTQGRRMRKAGERTAIVTPGGNTQEPSSSSWLQYGGTERNYDAVDMGPCAFLELTILPKGSELSLAYEGKSMTALDGAGNSDTRENLNVINEMTIAQSQCNPELLLQLQEESIQSTNHKSALLESHNETLDAAMMSELVASDINYIEGLETTFTSVLGGLQKEVDTIIRRVLDGRALQFRNRNVDDSRDRSRAIRAKEMQEMLDLGLHPVRGLLLYGSPGCGKTALAREISTLLTDRPPKIVSAPELLDRWVGGSEKLVRALFADAEAELVMCNGDPTKSGLHVIVIDEIDAVFRKRSSASDSGEVVRASAVNQILVKLDGVNALGNVLVIGTTNRRELLDTALLRPGRLEVQLEVPLPDREGRREILQIHFGPLRERGRLSRPLCEAIDGVTSRNDATFPNNDDETDSKSSSLSSSFLSMFTSGSERRRRRIRGDGRGGGGRRQIKDLASDRYTKGFSGADIAGLVRCAGSLALSRARKDGSGVDGLLITIEDVLVALKEVKQ